MAGSVNKVILIGRLGADPEIRYTQGGSPVANLRLATNESWKGKDGNKEERTEWHKVVCWAKLAELASQYLSKGRQVYIEGRLQTRMWEDKDGQKRYSTEIVASTLQFLGAGSSKGAGAEGSSADVSGDLPMPPEEFAGNEEDIPF